MSSRPCRIFFVFAVAVSVAAVEGCANSSNTQSLTNDQLVHRLSNSDITWGGTFGGLGARATSEIAHAILQRGSPARPALVAALDDPEKFAAAHVLLTMNYHEPFRSSVSSWNRLQVTLYGDGSVDLHPEQRREIKSLWQRKLDGTYSEIESDPLLRDLWRRLTDRDAEITAAFSKIQIGMDREEVGSLMPTPPSRTTKRSSTWVLTTERNRKCTIYFANDRVRSKDTICTVVERQHE